MQFAAPQRGAVLLFEHIVSPRPGPRQFQAVTECSFFVRGAVKSFLAFRHPMIIIIDSLTPRHAKKRAAEHFA
jgi:hypothetical protein